MIQKAGRKGMKRKTKRLMAAVAGAAVLSSTLLPGLPAIRAHAAGNNTGTENPIAVEQAGAAPSKTEDPVKVVANSAAALGLNARGEGFELVSSTDEKATVQVHDSDRTFKVDLYQKGGKWVIATVRGRPAAYNNSKFSNGIRSGILHFRRAVQDPVAVIRQQLLYQSDKFSGWQWREDKYPLDMVLGVLLVDPRPGGGAGAPDNPLNPINDVDFSRQFVLYAHLGTVAPKGYGIGIAKVVQSGNDLTVTVNAKSMQPNEALTVSKTDDFVALDRGTLDFNRVIKVAFVSQDGSVLSSYSLDPS